MTKSNVDLLPINDCAMNIEKVQKSAQAIEKALNTSRHWTAKLEELKACKDAIDWCKTQPSLKIAWKTCKNPEWKIWLIGRLSGNVGSEMKILLAKCLEDIIKQGVSNAFKGLANFHKYRVITYENATQDWENTIANHASWVVHYVDCIENEHTLNIIDKYYSEAPKLSFGDKEII